MTRLQILELPEGAGDERAPFLLVIDQCQGVTLELVKAIEAHWKRVGEDIGAQGTLIFMETVDIPANDVPVDPDGYPLKIRVEPDFEQFREQIQDEIRKAQADVAQALRGARNLPDSRESTGRPTHPDGTPYNYSEIVAGGWGHCDGCRTWGQWTSEKPHDCINSQAMSATPDA